MNLKLKRAALMIGVSAFMAPAFAQDTTSNYTIQSSQMMSTSPTYSNSNPDRFSSKDFRTWSIGVNAGILTPYTPFRGESNDFNYPQEHLGYGAYIKKQIIPSFGIQADFMAGKVEGRRASKVAGMPTYNDSRFESRINWSGALTGNFTIANLSVNHERGYFSPYLKAGVGYMSSNVKLTSDLGNDRGYERNYFIPVGAGFKIGISKGINLDLGYDVNFVRSANFDGVNSGKYDNFSYAHGGLEFALGKSSNPQLANYSALAALRKANAAESAELRSKMMAAQQQAQMMNQQLKDQYMKDLGDDDMDGVANKFDKCPGTPAGTVVDGAGCPLVMPKPQIIENTKVIVTEADRAVVKDAIKNLEFDLGKSTIRDKSFESLNKVAALLVEKNFSLKLAGHTDNTGSRELNLRLSKDRAESVKAYLVAQGANPSRIEATGYGPDQPISTNKTAEG
ncbi:MAG: OmpA family protein, partial [Ginsengibacter sp.]